jgi:hypothetical protein
MSNGAFSRPRAPIRYRFRIPLLRVQEQHPAAREQDVRDHHRDDGDDPEEELEGDVGRVFT